MYNNGATGRGFEPFEPCPKPMTNMEFSLMGTGKIPGKKMI